MKKIFTGLLLLSLLCANLLLVQQTHAKPLFEDICTTGSNAGSSKTCQNGGPGVNNPVTGTQGVILKVTNIVSLITGIAAIFAIIVGGIRFITSSGDPNSVNAAKNTVLYAIIGLVVVVAAQAIIVFVINRLS